MPTTAQRHNPQARIIELPRLFDSRGNLSVIEEGERDLFEIRRLYWIYDVPGGEERGSHAFRATDECIVALSGSFDVVLHDGLQEDVYSLNRSYKCLLVPRMLWRTLRNFATNSVALILASTEYDEADYIRDFDYFCRAMRRD